LEPSGARVSFVDTSSLNREASFPGSSMQMRVYLPPGDHAPASIGCVLVAPAGTNLLHGNAMDNDDYHAETLPYVEAGMAVVFYSLDGPMPDAELSESDYTDYLRRAYPKFRAAGAGVVNGRNALEFVLAKLPQVDPERIYCAGHSSAGTLSLLLAAHEPRLRGCVAYAPATDVALRLEELTSQPTANLLLPGVSRFVTQASPKTHMRRIQCPVFLFHARDDSNEPFTTTAAFARQMQQQHPSVTFVAAVRGNHYQSMIDEGLPRAVRWLQRSP
jgi:dienelactone hydrolase